MEDNKLTTVLEERYRVTLEAVTEAKAGSEEAKWEMEKLCKLHDQLMDERSNDTKLLEMEEKKQAASDEKKEKVWRKVVDAATILVPVLSSGYWMAKALTFEQTGTFTSRAAQWVNTHLRKK